MVARFIPAGKELFFKPDGSVVIPEFINSTIPVGLAQKITNLDPTRPSNPLKGGASTQQEKTNTTAATSKKNLPSLVRNPMEIFASSTVLWTFACLSPAQYNNPPSYRKSPADLKNIVFSSAGRFDENRVNTFYGTPEYYINNFTMINVIGANESTGNSNAVKFSFDCWDCKYMYPIILPIVPHIINVNVISDIFSPSK
jgi:hypothetical protein